MPVEGEPFFLIRALDAGPVPAAELDRRCADLSGLGGPDAGARPQLARDAGLRERAIGLDFGSYCMPLSRFARLKAALPRGAASSTSGRVVWELRLNKSPAEIALLRRAALWPTRQCGATAAACVRGASQRDAAKVAVAAFVELGADPGPPGPISAGRGWDFLHGHLEDTAARSTATSCISS